MKELIERFYNSIRLRGEPPIPYREIILTARIMDEIFSQIYRDSEQQPEDSDRRQAASDRGKRMFHWSRLTDQSSVSQIE